jgi:hypothetical protein
MVGDYDTGVSSMLKAQGHSPLSAGTTQVTIGSGGAISLSNGVGSQIAFKALPPGTYLVFGTVDFSLANATCTELAAGIGTTSGTFLSQAGSPPVGPDPNTFELLSTVALTGVATETVGPVLVTVTSGTPSIVLNAAAFFTVGSVQVIGTLTVIQLNIP